MKKSSGSCGVGAISLKKKTGCEDSCCFSFDDVASVLLEASAAASDVDLSTFSGYFDWLAAAAAFLFLFFDLLVPYLAANCGV